MKSFHKNIILILLILLSNHIFSQKIRVIDSINGRPIANVFVFDLEKKNRKISNINGVVNLDEFKEYDSVVFRHIVYENKIFLFKDKGSKLEIK